MLELLVGISLGFVVLELLDEWQQRRRSQRRLSDMRQRSSVMRRPWDTLRGRWLEPPGDQPPGANRGD